MNVPRKPPSPTSKTPFSLFDVITQNEFMIVGGVGLAIVVVALLMDSSYAWVIFFGYLLVLLPGLFVFLRRPPPAEVEEARPLAPVETDAHRALRAKLAMGAETKSFVRDEYARALLHYKQTFQSHEAVRRRLPSHDKAAHEKLAALFVALIDRLQLTSRHLQTVSALDTNGIMKRIQGLQTKGKPGERDQAELHDLHEKIAAREQTLSLVMDALHDNEKALREMVALGLKSSGKKKRRA